MMKEINKYKIVRVSFYLWLMFFCTPLILKAQLKDYHAIAKELVKKMTLKEKGSLCSAMDTWSTKPIERLGVPSITVMDGPHGLRKQIGNEWGKNIPATCFPTASALAATWNTDLLAEVGAALAEECQANNIQILLGPGVNIKRSPLCGRNFEYFSEDPVLAGKMAAAYITGLQSGGVGAALKHFAANNQETGRLTTSSNIDERTLHEIYLRAFEIPVKEANPWSIMSSYNLINHEYGSQNYYLLRDVLRRKWGFQNIVMTDWGAVHDRVKGVIAGCNLEMPSTWGYFDSVVISAVEKGELREIILDSLVTDIVSVALKASDMRKPNFNFNKEAHYALARKAAGESIVLLKNENILPLNLKKIKSISVIGTCAKSPHYQGGGSSAVTPLQLTNVYDELKTITGDKIRLSYSKGYDENFEENISLITEAQQLAKNSNIAIVCVALPDSCDSEGFDRLNIDLPKACSDLIKAIAKVQPNIIVVLMNGSAVSIPWLNKVKGIAEAWLSGEASGAAVADVLTGLINPSGKLAETFPVRIEDTPPYPDYPGLNDEADYGEGIFVGYRYYDKRKITPLFPFGYGLSYTTFEYKNLKTDKSLIKDTDSVKVTFDIKNKGKIAGKEIVQLYVHDQGKTVVRPEKELKHFYKISLEPGETKTINFILSYRDFAWYNIKLHDWCVNTGKFDVMIGGSSQSLPLNKTVFITSVKK